MSTITISRNTTLPDSSGKADFHNLVDTATATITDITNSEVASGAAIANSKLNLASIGQAIAMNAKIFSFSKGSDVASVAGAMTLGGDGNYFDITGTEAITSITAKSAGTLVSLQFDSTASLVDGGNLKLNGNFTGAAGSTITLISDGTNWFEISRQPDYVPSASNALAGSVVQVVNYQTGAYASGSTVIPWDDHIPKNTEGDEYMTLAITPKSATNKLKIEVVCSSAANAASNQICVALFQDTTANALACVFQTSVSDETYPLNFTHYMDAGTTSATTFKVRAGQSASTAFYFNGHASVRLGGGAIASSITITEIKV